MSSSEPGESQDSAEVDLGTVQDGRLVKQKRFVAEVKKTAEYIRVTAFVEQTVSNLRQKKK